LDSPNNSIRKFLYFFDKRDNTTTEIEATITLPVPVAGIKGDHFCYLHIDKILSPHRKIVGVDAFQAVELAMQLADSLLSVTRPEYDVLQTNGVKYKSLYGK